MKNMNDDLVSRPEALYILAQEKRELESCLAQETDRNFVQYEEGCLAEVEKITFLITNSLGTEARRCKDCRYRYLKNNIWHCPFGLSGGEDFFCGYSVQPSESSGDTSGTQKELKCTETHSCDCERTETHAQWIPVSEASLPEDGVTVWVTIKGYDVISCEDGETLEQAIARISKIRWVTQGYWSDEEHGWNDPSFGCPLMVQPIAWMPMEMPEPYEGEQE